MDKRPFTKRQVTSGEHTVPVTRFFLYTKCYPTSNIITEGIQGIEMCGLSSTPRK